MTTIRLTDGDLGGETMRVRCDVTRAEATVEVDYGDGHGWVPTQYECADARHRRSGLVEVAKSLAARAVSMPVADFACDIADE